MPDETDEQRRGSVKDKLLSFLSSFFQRNTSPSIRSEPDQTTPSGLDESSGCCDGLVHIGYRGISDDRMYVAYGRKWSELKFFRGHGLRVFCASCRRKLYP